MRNTSADGKLYLEAAPRRVMVRPIHTGPTLDPKIRMQIAKVRALLSVPNMTLVLQVEVPLY